MEMDDHPLVPDVQGHPLSLIRTDPMRCFATTPPRPVRQQRCPAVILTPLGGAAPNQPSGSGT